MHAKTLVYNYSLESPGYFSLRCAKENFTGEEGETVDAVNKVLTSMDDFYADRPVAELDNSERRPAFVADLLTKATIISNPILKWHIEFVLSFFLGNSLLEINPLTTRMIKGHLVTAERNFIVDEPPSPELYWYKALAVCRSIDDKESINNEDLRHYLECIRRLPNKDYHKGVLGMLIENLEKYGASEYLHYANLAPFAELLIAEGLKPGDFLVHSNHKFVDRYLREQANADFFAHIKSRFLTEPSTDVYSLELALSDSFLPEAPGVRINIALTPLAMLKYVSQLTEIWGPVFRFFKDERDELLKELLQNQGFVNSEGMLIPDRVYFYEPYKKTYRINKEFVYCLTALLNKARYGFYSEKQVADDLSVGRVYPQNYAEVEAWCHTKFLKYIEWVCTRRKLVEYFPARQMLALHYQALSIYTPDASLPIYPKQDEIKQLLAACLNIAEYAYEIFNPKPGIVLGSGMESRHARCYELAQKIVAELCTKRCNLILQVGTPIKPGATASDHAFYVGIRYERESDCFKIIIMNGGDGLLDYHYRDTTLSEKEFAALNFGLFHPVVFEPLSRRNKDHQQFLIHYIYRVLSLAYGQEYLKTIDYKKDSPTFNPLTNVYLGVEDEKLNLSHGEFVGFGSYRATWMKRANSKELPSYRAQLFGNCTNQNFTSLLRYIVDMDPLEAGTLLDVQLYAADQLITMLKTRAPAAAPARAGAGIGTDSGSTAIIRYWEDKAQPPASRSGLVVFDMYDKIQSILKADRESSC